MYDSNAYDAQDDTGFEGTSYMDNNAYDANDRIENQGGGLLQDDEVAKQAEINRGGGMGGVDFDVNAGKTTKHLLPHEREAELNRREKRILAIENEINKREKKTAKQWKKYRGEKNWPSSCWRLAHHAMQEDIPEQHRWKVRQMYFLWIINAVAILMNWVLFCAWFFWPKDSADGTDSPEMSSGAGSLLLATLYVVVGLPSSWLWWYKRYYNTYAGRVNNGRLGTRHFMNFGIHVLFAIYMAIGIESSASGGLFLMIKLISHNLPLGILCLISFVLFLIDALASLWLFRRQRVDNAMQIVQDFVDKNGVQQGGSDLRSVAAGALVDQAIKNPKIAASVAKGVLQSK